MCAEEGNQDMNSLARFFFKGGPSSPFPSPSSSGPPSPSTTAATGGAGGCCCCCCCCCSMSPLLSIAFPRNLSFSSSAVIVAFSSISARVYVCVGRGGVR